MSELPEFTQRLKFILIYCLSRGYTHFSCSTHLSMKFIMFITRDGILIFISYINTNM